MNSTDEELLESLSGVTLNVTPDNQMAVKANSKLTNQRATTITELTKPTNMTSNVGIANESENNMLSAIARLETKLVDSRKNDIIEMEKRLTTNMKVIVDNSIQEAFKNITSTITAIVSADPEILRQKRNILQLQNENRRLARKVQVLDTEYHKLKQRINNMEQKSLDHTMIIRGIREVQDETETTMKDCIHAELAETVGGETQDEKLQIARGMEIKHCKRIGRYNRQRARPLSVELK